MKKVLIIGMTVACLAVVAVSHVSAEGGTVAAISVNPLALVVDTFEGSFELAFTRHISAKIDLVYSPNLAWISGISLLGVSGEVRFYFMSTALSGLFLGAGGGVDAVSGANSGVTYDGTIPFGFAELGYKLILGGKSGIYLEPYVGYSVAFGSVTTTGGGASATASAIGSGFLYGTGVGFAF